MCVLGPSPWFDGFSSAFLCALGKIFKAISNDRTLIMRCNKKGFFKNVWKHPEKQLLPCFQISIGFETHEQDSRVCSLPTVAIKLKKNYSLTNISLDAVTIQTEAY